MKLPFGFKIERGKRRDWRKLNISAAFIGIGFAGIMCMAFLPGAMKGNHADIAYVICILLEFVLSIAVGTKEYRRLSAIRARRMHITAATLNASPDTIDE